MAESFTVPTQGFAVPPAGAPAGAPQVPQAPQPQGGIPPAPGAYVSGNGRTIEMLPPGVAPQPQNHAPYAQPQAQPQQQLQGQAPAMPDLDALRALLGQPAAPATQAPVTQAPAAPAAELPTWAGESLHTFDLTKVSDPATRGIGQALQAIAKDVDLDRALGAALAHGDPSRIDIAYLVEKGGANAATIAELGKSLVASVAQVAEANTQRIYASVGGEQNWHVAVAAFNAGADLTIRQAVAKMMDSGDETMINYGAALIGQYAQGGAVPRPPTGIGNVAGGGVAAHGLSKTEFQAELQKLNPRAQGYDEAYNALATRRAAGRSAGL